MSHLFLSSYQTHRLGVLSLFFKIFSWWQAGKNPGGTQSQWLFCEPHLTWNHPPHTCGMVTLILEPNTDFSFLQTQNNSPVMLPASRVSSPTFEENFSDQPNPPSPPRSSEHLQVLPSTFWWTPVNHILVSEEKGSTSYHSNSGLANSPYVYPMCQALSQVTPTPILVWFLQPPRNARFVVPVLPRRDQRSRVLK